MATVKDDRPARVYPWSVVAMLWFCGFFNYADRQAIFSILDLIGQEFQLDNLDKGAIGSSFMIVYALSAPLAGFVVDRVSRRWLIPAGLALWSVICAATGYARSYGQLLFFRAAEGLGESFYFPASMSILADYHGPRTRSRAMSIHQTSVYAGTAAGGILAGYLGKNYGWRSPFLILGMIGLGYSLLLPFLLVEPKRGAADPPPDPLADRELDPSPIEGKSGGFFENILAVIRIPAAAMLLAVFAGANFVAATLLAWLPSFVKEQHGLDLFAAATVAGLFFPLGNAVGALYGGVVADFASTRIRGGRVLVQASGLLLGAPFVWIAGRTTSLLTLQCALVMIGACKGIYDANIFASVYDVVTTRVRGTAAGLMNTVAWSAGGAAPALVGWLSREHGLSAVIAWTSGVYAVAGLLALVAAYLVGRAKRIVT